MTLKNLDVSPEVASALAEGRPVVALESAVITHGLPRPLNSQLAHQLEAILRAERVVPATTAVLSGRPTLGIATQDLENLATAEGVLKVSRRDLGVAASLRVHGGTTVAATMLIAHAGGVRIMATGGIGGVHRGAGADVSADLPELARTPVAVVCSGAKSILDLPRTLEWLETAGVPVIGFGVDEFPAFFSRSSGLHVSVCVDHAEVVSDILQAHWGLGLTSGVLVCVPCPEEFAVPGDVVEDALARAEALATARGVSGKELTPFLLSQLAALTGEATLRANLALLRHNAEVAALVANALAARG